MNQIDDDIEEAVASIMMRTTEDFGMTLSSNKMSDEAISRLHKVIKINHKGNIELAQQLAEVEGTPTDQIVIDDQIHIKRLQI